MTLGESAVPGVYKSSVAATVLTLEIPDDRLLVYPGLGLPVTINFNVPTTGTYNYNVQFSSQSTLPVPVDLFLILSFNNVFLSGNYLATIGTGLVDYSASGTVSLAAGTGLGFVFAGIGNPFLDAVGFNLTFATVPEPASWSMMIIGFGLAGAVMRRRSARPARVLA